MKKVTIQLTLKQAVEWYNSGDSFRKGISMTLYPEKKLIDISNKIKYPSSWKEYLKYHDIKPSYRTLLYDDSIPNKYKAMAKLELLRNCYRNGMIPNYIDDTPFQCIEYYNGKLIIKYIPLVPSFLSFWGYEAAPLFLENFESLIKEAEDLIE